MPASSQRIPAMPQLQCHVNGHAIEAVVEPQTLLVDFLRDDLKLTGTHIGCDTAQCGACTVLVDGAAVRSCTMLAIQSRGRRLTTIEGLSEDGRLHPIQDAFIHCHGLQCGFCTPGMIISTAALLSEHRLPDDGQIAQALEGNLCRCTGYVNIVASVRAAAQAMAEAGVQA
jgi:carbon-monoxide dehydrogenase small subunit